MALEKNKKFAVQQAIDKYHKYQFKLQNIEFMSNIDNKTKKMMNNYVKMFDNLIKQIKEVEGIEYIDKFILKTKYFDLNCSISNYYYRRQKVNNILWKYLFDC